MNLNAVTQATIGEIRKLLASLSDDSDESTRIAVLEKVLVNRCRRCLDYDERGSFWCCYDSRGG
jgi:hypothetical protein